MLKRLAAILTTVLAIFTLAACTVPVQPPLPPEKELRLEQYPVLAVKRPMTAVQVHDPGLRVMRLERSIGAFVHFRYGVDQRGDKEGHWHYQVLESGTMVAVDRDGRPWYLIDGSNRLYVPVEQLRNTAASAASGQGGGPGEWSPWWWWLLLLAAALAILWLWLLQRTTDRVGDPDDDPMAWRMPRAGAATATADATAATGAGVATAAAAQPATDPPAGTAQNDRMAAVESDVAEIRESLTSLEGRVTSTEKEIATVRDLFTVAIQEPPHAKAPKAKVAWMTDAELATKVVSGELSLNQALALKAKRNKK